jgi:hypothetical protein
MESKYDLQFKTATIVELTPTYVGVLMDGSVHFNIGITKRFNAFDIKRNILNHASKETGLYFVPYSKMEDIPEEIRNKLDVPINLEELKEEIIEEEEKINAIKIINCKEARDQILPDYIEFLEALYEKDANNNPEKYNELLKRINLAYKLFPPELGESISVKEYEEIINGL